MSKLSSVLLRLLVVFSTVSTVAADTGDLIKNGETPVVQRSGNEVLYTYGSCKVKTVAGDEGEQIVILFENGDSYEFCEVDMNAYFYGIHGDFLYVLNRGGLFGSLVSFSLVELDMDPYEEFVIPEGGAEIEGNQLIVWQVQEAAAPAVMGKLREKAETLENEDLTVFYTRKVIYDYATKELTETEDYDCVGVVY